MAEFQVAFDTEFFAATAALTAADGQRVLKAVDRFRKDPKQPGLRLKRLHGDPTGRLHSIRAADDIRVLLAREGNTYVFLRAGQREHIYDCVERGGRWIQNPATKFIGFIAPAPNAADGGAADPAPRPTPPPEAVGIFDHWSATDLAEAGFGPEQIAQLRACKTEDALFDLSWDPADFDLAVDLINQTPEQWRTPALLVADDGREQTLRQAIAEFGAAHGISPLFGPDEVARIAAAPIEEWMIFLHPDQRTIVDRRYEGPARVRGSAGTGKTVVGLHRAAALAARFRANGDTGPILFTTFIRTLPPVFEQLYARLPSAAPNAVEFSNVDKVARKVCSDAGIRVVTDTNAIDSAFAKAWSHAAAAGSAIGRAGLTRQYVRDEITHVIKGRGITSVDVYLHLERTGRRTRFGEPLRREVWQLMERWDTEMRERGTIDFCDVVRMARDIARRDSQPRYRAAIIDEAQDITLVGLQFVRALVNGNGSDRADNLLIVGDGAQRIYAGGFTLRQAGIDVTGRATVLRRNYRNTAEIIGAAMAVAGDEAVDDLGDEFRRGEAPADAPRRTGFVPKLVVCPNDAAELKFLEVTIAELVTEEVVGLGDIGVFAHTNRQVDTILDQLSTAGIAAMKLERYDGRTTSSVKVGTYHRAKGLEFKVVMLPFLSAGVFPRQQEQHQDDAEYAEARSLAVAQLFVAMTRARDGLFVLCSREPSSTIESALDHFEVVDA